MEAEIARATPSRAIPDLSPPRAGVHQQVVPSGKEALQAAISGLETIVSNLESSAARAPDGYTAMTFRQQASAVRRRINQLQAVLERDGPDNMAPIAPQKAAATTGGLMPDLVKSVQSALAPIEAQLAAQAKKIDKLAAAENAAWVATRR